MTQSNANNFNINALGGATELQTIIRSMMSNISTGELVRVVDVNNDGVSPVGFVSVQPLVYKIDGDNNNVDRGIIHNVPYFRLQGGANAIIIDPQVDDIGFCGICSRDISLVKRVRSYAPPNMRRNSDISDAVYMGGCLNGTPEQYVWFKENEIVVKSATKVTIDSPITETTGQLIVNGNAIVTGTMVVTGTIDGAGISLSTHTHGGVQAGNGNTGVPK